MSRAVIVFAVFGAALLLYPLVGAGKRQFSKAKHFLSYLTFVVLACGLFYVVLMRLG